MIHLSSETIYAFRNENSAYLRGLSSAFEKSKGFLCADTDVFLDLCLETQMYSGWKHSSICAIMFCSLSGVYISLH